MGLPELLKGNTGLRSAKECFHVLFGQVEHSSTVTFGVLISGTRNTHVEKKIQAQDVQKTYFESLR